MQNHHDAAHSLQCEKQWSDQTGIPAVGVGCTRHESDEVVKKVIGAEWFI